MMGLVEQVVGRSINSLVDGVLVAAAAWLLLRVTGTRNSGVRFAVWFSALLAIAAMFGFRNSAITITHSDFPEIVVPSNWAVYLFAAWGILALSGLVRVGVGLWRLQRIRRDSQPLSATEQSALGQLPLARGAVVRISNQVRVPAAIGFFHPAILLPKWALEELSPQDLDAVLRHELAHLRRWDDWTNLAQKVIRALLFFHPAVWWVESRLSIEREMSCDDLVLAQSNNPREYAECLVTVAERGFLRRPVALAQAAVERMKHTAQRISKILDGRQRSATSAWKPALVALTTFMVLGAVAVDHTPQLVGFQTSPQVARGTAVRAEFAGHVVPAMARLDQSELELARTPRPVVTHALRTKKSVTSESSQLIAKAALSGRDLDPAIGSQADQSVRSNTADWNAQVVNASAKQNASPVYMLVVFQTQEHDQTGNVVVRTYVLRIPVPPQTVIDPRST